MSFDSGNTTGESTKWLREAASTNGWAEFRINLFCNLPLLQLVGYGFFLQQDLLMLCKIQE